MFAKTLFVVALTIFCGSLIGCARPIAGPSDDQPGLAQPDLAQPGGVLSELPIEAKRLYWRTNELRTRAGLRPLELRAELCVLARQQVATMIEQGQLTNFSPAGEDVAGRLIAEGIEWTVCAENVGRFRGQGDVVDAMMKKWQANAADRENILHELCRQTGLAIVKDDKTNNWYAAQIFLRQSLFWEK